MNDNAITARYVYSFLLFDEEENSNELITLEIGRMPIEGHLVRISGEEVHHLRLKVLGVSHNIHKKFHEYIGSVDCSKLFPCDIKAVRAILVTLGAESQGWHSN